jgi:hypothetical protein
MCVRVWRALSISAYLEAIVHETPDVGGPRTVGGPLCLNHVTPRGAAVHLGSGSHITPLPSSIASFLTPKPSLMDT